MEVNILYSNIRKRREALGMSQVELAKRLKYKSRSSVNKIELGFTDLPLSKVKEFAAALKTTPAALMGWDHKSGKSSPIHEKLTKSIEYEYGSGVTALLNRFSVLNILGKNTLLDRAGELCQLAQYTEKGDSDLPTIPSNQLF
ncbi:MAG: helix-turn-helix transcriptional regulator [Chitinispirillia bacterium]|nr:helix-turn-helix transcriptional regulator [Chitinispirillia bacterium]